MTTATLFPGTGTEAAALASAILHWCECSVECPTPCAAHRLLTDPRVLGHLVFVRRIAVDYEAGEFNLARES